ncbi:MAG: hypothetical protein IH944_02770 [Armatimonadetes bacterium]|nr:hypothetical protein [Armatimonadota bacterium]
MTELDALPESGGLETNEVSPSSTSMILDIVGGIDVGESFAEALLANSENARLFTGGLIGNGQIQRIIGVNMVLPRSNAGILFGLVPDDTNTLFPASRRACSRSESGRGSLGGRTGRPPQSSREFSPSTSLGCS